MLHNRHHPTTSPWATHPVHLHHAVVIVHLYWSRPAAAEHYWQRVMPGRQLSKHSPVPRTESEQQYDGKKCANSLLSLLPRRKSTHGGNKKAFMCMYQFNYAKLWKCVALAAFLHISVLSWWWRWLCVCVIFALRWVTGFLQVSRAASQYILFVHSMRNVAVSALFSNPLHYVSMHENMLSNPHT